jgi:hypothetical protein
MILALAACGTERDGLPVSDAPPAQEQQLELPAGHPPIHDSPDAEALPPGHPPIHGSPDRDALPPGHPPLDRSRDSDAPAGLAPGRQPAEIEAVRQRYLRGPIWVA